MYDIRQFKPALYILILLGMCSFALAEESATASVLSAIALLINAWLVHRGLFRPMPRLFANLVTTCALIYVIHEVLTSGNTPVLMIGEFLMLLQIVKLWEQRANRDYAQLLVLSLLLMVAAAISTASIVFGLMMVAYLFLSLYCCLLFHLKVETDAAREGLTLPQRVVAPAVLRQDQRYLSRSMRRLTGVVSAVAILFAVLVFLFFPRGTGAGMLGPVQFKPTQSLVGFNDEVSFQSVAKIEQNEAEIATVKVRHNGQRVQGGTILLRGVTLDCYTGNTGKAGTWRWVRWPKTGLDDSREDRIDRRLAIHSRNGFENGDFGPPAPHEVSGETVQPLAKDAPEPTDQWEQDIQLHPTGTNVLFAMAGAYSIGRIAPTRSIEYRYYARDGQLKNLSMRDRAPGETHYKIISSNSLGDIPPPLNSGTRPENIDPRIKQFALREEVSGKDANGSLAVQRQKRGHFGNEPDELDEQIALNIEHYLKSNFDYTLDLTDSKRIEGQDPLVAFLYDIRKGHCEYFAGAMTLMCQSVGLHARMCLGFRCSEYNGTPGADYFIVRQSHAHAWVEVLTKQGWKTFDPTSESDAKEQARKAGAMLKIRHVIDYLQYAYSNAIITYSNEDRTNLIQSTESVMLRATNQTSTPFDLLGRFQFDRLFESRGFLRAFSGILIAIMMLMAATAFLFIARYALDRWRLRRRAARIGIGSLPEGEQMRLARQLKFYDDLIVLLGSHQISRLPQHTPLEFSRSLLFLPAETYEAVRRLTLLFYRVRYGRAQLSPEQLRRLARAVKKVEADLNVAKSG